MSVKSTLAKYKQREDSLSSMFVLGAVSSFRLRILSSAPGLRNSAFLFIDSCSLYDAIFCAAYENATLQDIREGQFFQK